MAYSAEMKEKHAAEVDAMEDPPLSQQKLDWLAALLLSAQARAGDMERVCFYSPYAYDRIVNYFRGNTQMSDKAVLKEYKRDGCIHTGHTRVESSDKPDYHAGECPCGHVTAPSEQ